MWAARPLQTRTVFASVLAVRLTRQSDNWIHLANYGTPPWSQGDEEDQACPSIYHQSHDIFSPITWGFKRKNEQNFLTRKAYKAALQIPMSASTAGLERLGVHNTAQKLVEAHHINQLRRLSTMSTGPPWYRGPSLFRTGYPHPTAYPPLHRPRPPLPENMHPTYHRGRMEQRALTKKFPIKPDILYRWMRPNTAITTLLPSQSLIARMSPL